MSRFLPIIPLACFLLAAATGHATHNRAGEITYEQIGDLTIRATITTYTKASSTQADRDSLELVWGDGTSDIVGRANGGGEGVPIGNDIKYNIYVAEHTYPGRATYTISMRDPNRIAGIRNVNYPNSVIVPFYIETTFTFLNPQFQGYNNSPLLLQPPIDNGCVGQRFIHNPNAYDPDGDSLSYELIVPLQGKDSAVTRYEFPDQIEPGPANQIFFDEVTGDFIWDAPQLQGEYNIAIFIKEYRNGVLINTTIRDMQITIGMCDNRPPEVTAVDEICVIAGELIEFPVRVTDPDISQNQLVRLSGTGGPFQLDVSPAEFDVLPGFRNQPLEGTFRWQTTCDHVNEQYYSVIFKGEDNFFDSIGLVDLYSVKIKVSGPPPENIDAMSDSEKITISWDSPYDCEVTETDYFKGFTVWRKRGSTPIQLDTCGVDLDALGYTVVAFNRLAQTGGRYYYEDPNVEKGITYCYRVTGEFALTSPGGNPYNRVQSLPSEEICYQLRRDVPLITNVSVEETSVSTGRIRIVWENALPDDLDTISNPGPYRLQLRRAEGVDGSEFFDLPGAVFTSPTFGGLRDDTSYLHTDINTRDLGYRYEIAFSVRGQVSPYGYSAPASSVYLDIISSDRKNVLNWEYDVPWVNYEWEIYRRGPSDPDYSFYDITDEPQYKDSDLANGREYCYYVRSVGTYGIPDVKDPLYNLSQRTCGTPVDTVAPCPLALIVRNICDEEIPGIEPEVLVNHLLWEFIDDGECSLDDVFGFRIYYTSDTSAGFELLTEVDDPQSDHFEHLLEDNLAGCYYVTSVDSAGNESKPGNIFCASNCPLYSLPNVFTPNRDGSNDLYQPFPYRFVERVDFQVFNRWGKLVFETEDPDLNWDGTDMNGNELSSGTYYYTCEVLNYSSGSEVANSLFLNGYIELIR